MPSYIPKSFYDGEEFEKYVLNAIFPKEYYTLLERSPTYRENKIEFNILSLKPDFKLKITGTNTEFYLEAKYRSGIYDDHLTWCNTDQFERYQSYSYECPVFVIIGLYGKSYKPKEISLFPLKEIYKPSLPIEVFQLFSIVNHKPFPPKTILEVLGR